jgi:hypothetical protein
MRKHGPLGQLWACLARAVDRLDCRTTARFRNWYTCWNRMQKHLRGRLSRVSLVEFTRKNEIDA